MKKVYLAIALLVILLAVSFYFGGAIQQYFIKWDVNTYSDRFEVIYDVNAGGFNCPVAYLAETFSPTTNVGNWVCQVHDGNVDSCNIVSSSKNSFRAKVVVPTKYCDESQYPAGRYIGQVKVIGYYAKAGCSVDGKQIAEGETWCDGNKLMKCVMGTAVYSKLCANGCSNGQCISGPAPSMVDITFSYRPTDLEVDKENTISLFFRNKGATSLGYAAVYFDNEKLDFVSILGAGLTEPAYYKLTPTITGKLTKPVKITGYIGEEYIVKEFSAIFTVGGNVVCTAGEKDPTKSKCENNVITESICKSDGSGFEEVTTECDIGETCAELFLKDGTPIYVCRGSDENIDSVDNPEETAEAECELFETRCSGNDLEYCSEEGVWEVATTCDIGCEDAICIQETKACEVDEDCPKNEFDCEGYCYLNECVYPDEDCRDIIDKCDTVPDKPCEGATWKEYPTCKWDSSSCKGLTEEQIMFLTVAGIVALILSLGVIYVFYIKKR